MTGRVIAACIVVHRHLGPGKDGLRLLLNPTFAHSVPPLLPVHFSDPGSPNSRLFVGRDYRRTQWPLPFASAQVPVGRHAPSEEQGRGAQ